ncbi:MAG TPA: hypothetical protein VJL87_01385 [Bdellovibrionota bacterium]|nr:hypothetical protein [Bdellovibrionota bacterium]
MIIRTIRAFIAIIVMFLYFFGVPIITYTIAARFFGMTPPVRLVMTDIYLVVIANLVMAASFVIIYAMMVEGRRTSGMLYGMVLALLMFLASALSNSVVSYAFYDLPYDYSRLVVIANAIAYMLAGLTISKLYTTPGPRVYA